MPPDDPNAAPWIRSDQIPKLVRQDLTPEEAEPFLAAMFANLAVTPKSVTLREGASVVRYLRATALSSEAGKERDALERHTEAVLQAVIRFARIKMATKKQAMRFLERHAEAYFYHPQFQATLEFLRSSTGPKPGVDFFPLPKLASRERVTFGSGPRVADDLSERIYAAYHALKRAKFHGARRLVAEALNRSNAKLAHRNIEKKEWGPDEVIERVKQYEKRLKRNLRGTRPESLLLARGALVDQWISFARSQMGTRTPPK